MAKICFLSLVFPPDSVSTAQIMGELAVELKRLGHDISVLTTTPHYNRDPEAEKRQPLKPFVAKILQKSEFNGIPVYHVRMPRKTPKVILRILAWINFHLISSFAGAFFLKRPDIYMVPSPPLTMGVNAWLLGVFHRSPFIYNVQEIYPDYAISMKAIRNKYLIALLYDLEAFVYKKAIALTVIADNMAKAMVEKEVPQDKVNVIPNFADIDDLKPLPKKNEFSEKYGINDKFVVSYAGNMGPGQDLESFIDAARFLKDDPNIRFLLMGDGMLREKLKRKVQSSGLKNFIFLDYQPYSSIPKIYAASDLCLVPQSQSIVNSAVPSKVYRIMACGRAVLASTGKQSDLANLVRKSSCGFIVESGSGEKLAEAIMNAEKKKEKLAMMGEAGREYVIKCFSRQSVAKQYHSLILSLMKK